MAENIPEKAKRVVITIHGIRTRGEWQKSITSEIANAGFIPDPWDYGRFPLLKFLLPCMRRKKIDWFRDQYFNCREKLRDTHPSVIAHSFGTYLVARAMQKYPEIVFDRIILCGSIIDRDYPWTDIIYQTKQCNSVLHDFGKLDLPARIAEWVVTDAGPSGVKGFTQEVAGKVIQRNHHEFGHSDYFYELNYKDRWIPFLNGHTPKEIIKSDHHRINWKFYVTISIAIIFLLLIIAVLVYRYWPSKNVSNVTFVEFVSELKQAEKQGDQAIKTLIDQYHGSRVKWDCIIIEEIPTRISYRIAATKDTTLYEKEKKHQAIAEFEKDEEFKSFIVGKSVKIEGTFSTVTPSAINLYKCQFIEK